MSQSQIALQMSNPKARKRRKRRKAHQFAKMRWSLKKSRKKQAAGRRRSIKHPKPHRYLPHRRTAIVCPEVLAIEKEPAFAASALEFLGRLYNTITEGNYDRVEIDHRPLREASPASILVLLAYTHHAMKTQPGVRLRALLPSSPEMLSTLQDVGYFNYYEQTEGMTAKAHMTGILGHLRETGVKTRLLAEFMRPLPAGVIPTSSLYEALVEAAQNADEWAYGRTQPYRYWWLMAHHPPKSGEIAICFMDLGQGIPVTIRSRLRDKLPFISKGADLIKKAVVEGRYSRTRRTNRGKGLPTLRKLIDGVQDGEMTVISRGSFFQYFKGGATVTRELTRGTDLRGTVITWRIKKQ